MKLRIQPEGILERIALAFNLAPIPLVDTQVYFNSARAIMAGSNIGVFEAIGTSSLTADEISDKCKTHPQATSLLLNALVGIGYLKYKNGKYSLKRRYQKWLLKNSEANVASKLAFQVTEWEWMNQLDNYVRTGTPVDMHSTMTPAIWAQYQEGMRDLSISTAKELATKLKLPSNASQMLDIGGSHGLFSIELCKRNPQLSSTILELPGAVDRASVIAARYGLQDRVKYKAGNALTDDLGEGQYDLVMINNVVHHFSTDENKALAEKIFRALKPGGLYAIGDFVSPQTPGEGGVVASTSGLYFALTSASGTWTLKEMQSWQSEAGLKIEKVINLMTLPGWKMTVGEKLKN
jgi:2-polyprenyl-3-methyl-5-hydroxy-6-metoxy-1,4-benzoquinol methylase